MSEVVELRKEVRSMIGALDSQLNLTIEAIYDMEQSGDDDAIKGLHQLKDEMDEIQNTITTIQELNGWI